MNRGTTHKERDCIVDPRFGRNDVERTTDGKTRCHAAVPYYQALRGCQAWMSKCMAGMAASHVCQAWMSKCMVGMDGRHGPAFVNLPVN